MQGNEDCTRSDPSLRPEAVISVHVDVRAMPPVDRTTRRSIIAGVLIGAGAMAATDEIVFHQILAWHHFYDRAPPAIALLSDGLLHAAELIAIVSGFQLWNMLRKQHALAKRYAVSGHLLGLAGFECTTASWSQRVPCPSDTLRRRRPHLGSTECAAATRKSAMSLVITLARFREGSTLMIDQANT